MNAMEKYVKAAEAHGAVRAAMVQEAITWIKTPYVDHAGIKGRGVDCAFLPIKILQAVGIIPADFVPPKYSPQQWLCAGEDTTYLDTLMKFAKREITDPKEAKPGDLALYMLHKSWTHGAFILSWPHMLIHPIKVRGVIGSQADEGMLWKRPRRIFSFVEDF
jgi:cell wall-associated NlpC family hydrolase